MAVDSIHIPAPAELTNSGGANRPRTCRDASVRRQRHSNGQARANWRALRVLVVGGQQDTVNARFKLTHRWGHTACLAVDGFVALRVAIAYQPDVVLLNKGITLVDRCQIARHLRFDFPRKDIWIIAVTGRIDDEGRNKCTEAGIDVLLAEPVDTDVLETLLMLECLRVNRSETDEAAAHSGEGFMPVRSHDNVN